MLSEEAMPKILVAVATYNEIENLPELTKQIFASLPESDLLVIDDGSPDGTGKWAAEEAANNPRLFLLERGAKKGLGTAVLEGFRFAIEGEYDYLINLDADFSHPPAILPKLLAAAENEGIDVVIGSRYVKGGKIIGWPLSRKLMSRSINAWARFFLRLSTKDNSGSLRCYRVSTLRKLDFARIRSHGYSFFEEILFRLKQCGAAFREIPITFTDRVRGSSKINRKEALKAVWLLFLIGRER